MELLLRRGNMALEDKEFDEAYKFFEQVLNRDVERAEAYLGKKLAQEKCRNLDEFVKARTDLSMKEWEMIQEKRIEDDPKWREYVADCVSKCQNKYPDLEEEDVTGIVSAVCDVDLWKRAAFWEKRFLDFQVEKESDNLIKRALQYGDRKLCQMLNKQLDDIMGVLKQKAQEETAGKAKHLRWVEEQVGVFADKQKELKKLEEDFQKTIKEEDLDKLQEYSPEYKKLAEYFKSVSRTTEADFCESRAASPRHMLEVAQQCDKSISEYRKMKDKILYTKKTTRRSVEKFQEVFEGYLNKEKGYLLPTQYNLCRNYYEECRKGVKYVKKGANRRGCMYGCMWYCLFYFILFFCLRVLGKVMGANGSILFSVLILVILILIFKKLKKR